MTTIDALPLDEINLIDPRIYVQGPPHDLWKRLRHEAPVFWHKPWTSNDPAATDLGGIIGAWHLTKYDDVMRVSRDPTGFISGKGITAYEPITPIEGMEEGGASIITIDPPRHVRLRRLVNKGFTPRQVALLEPHVREIVTTLLDGIADRNRCDFVIEVAANLPLAVICQMVGVPQRDWKLMFELTNRVLGGSDPEYQTAGEDVNQTTEQGRMRMLGYFMQLIQERQGGQQDDLLGILVGADIDGEKLSMQDILEFCFLLIVAGNETTRNATSGGLLALCEHPGQRARLLADPALLPSAIEEILRWTSPVMHMSRVATRDTEIRGQTIAAGQRLVMWYPSVNRDEDIFPNADTFDVTRSPNEHLAFGIGEHFCLGAGLARLELQVMFEELFRRMPDIELDGPAERLQSSFIGGIKHLPVRYAART